MSTSPPLSDLLAVQQILHDLWARTDRVVEDPAEELFADDGRMRIGTLRVEGRAAIDRYNRERRATEDKTGRRVRHFCTNHLVVDHREDSMTLRCAVLVFQGVGDMPFDASLPSNIADFVISFRKQAGGEWRIVDFDGTAIFRGPGAPDNAR